MLKKILKNVRRPQIDFEQYKKPRKPNICIMAPAGLCGFLPHVDSPVFDLCVDDLLSLFERHFFALPNTEMLTERKCGEAQADTQREYVHTSRIMGFPDTVTARFMPLEGNKSTFALLSRSHYGYRDLGVNKGRVMYLLKKMIEEQKITS